MSFGGAAAIAIALVAAAATAATGAAPDVDARIEDLKEQAKVSIRSSLTLIVRAKQIRQERPPPTAGEDGPARAGPQRELAAWIGEVAATRERARAEQASIETLRDELNELRKFDMSDATAEKLVRFGPTLDNVLRGLEREIQELDAARRQGVGAMDDAPAS